METLLLPCGSGYVASSPCHSMQGRNSHRPSDRVWLRSSRILVAPLNTKSPRVRNSMKRRNKAFAETETETAVATEEEGYSAAEVSEPTTVSEEVTRSAELLKTAARTRKVSAQEICIAFKTLEKAKLDRSNYPSIIGGTESPGRTWMLVYTVSKDVYNNRSEGGGSFFPVTAVQNFDTEGSTLQNGIYLGPIGNLTFSGKLKFDKQKLSFFVNSLNLTLGSWGPLRIKLPGKGDDEVPDKNDPFFLWYYADDEIIVAKGRSGGVAYWCRCINVAKN